MGGRTSVLAAFALVFFVLLSVWGTLAFAQEPSDFVVVVNADNPVSVLEKKDLAAMFLRKKRRWPDGEHLAPVDLLPKAAVRAIFSEQVHGKSVLAIRSYWQQQIFSGRGTPPPEVASEEAAIAYVQAEPGGVAYVSASADVSTVKVIEVR